MRSSIRLPKNKTNPLHCCTGWVLSFGLLMIKVGSTYTITRSWKRVLALCAIFKVAVSESRQPHPLFLQYSFAPYCCTVLFQPPVWTGFRANIGDPIVVGIISYAFLGLDAIGDEIENPFERDQNDLPLGAISHMIESNVRQRMGLEALELKAARSQNFDFLL